MKVTFFHRKPNSTNFSVEGTFQAVRSAMPEEVKCRVATSRYLSRGIFGRIYNIFEAIFRQGDVNHITGDVHFLSYLLRRDRTLLTILDCVVMYNNTGIKQYLLRLFWYVIPEKRVALISVISQSTKNELIKFIKCDPDKVRVVPVCISPAFTRFGKPFNTVKPKILQIGTGQNKNLIRLIEALKDIPCKLDIVGKLSQEHIDALSKNNINYTNVFQISDEEVLALYQQCDLVAFVSTYEGFGMPILEGNAVGRPVITSNLLSMPEVAGNAACLIDPYDVTQIRAGILRIISDEEYREILIENGFRNIERFEPRVIARQYIELYKELLEGGC